MPLCSHLVVVMLLFILNPAACRLQFSAQAGATSTPVRSGSSELLVEQIRAYWRCYKTVQIKPKGEVAEEESPYCPATFDGWGCWDATPAGQEASIPCPNILLSTDGPEMAVRECTSEGKWKRSPLTGDEEVDYSKCRLNASGSDPHLLLQIIEELKNLDSSPYDDKGTAEIFEDCLMNVLSWPRLENSKGYNYCHRTFDGWGCWNDTLPGTTAYIPCPSFITGFIPERYAHKECNPDGTWFRHPATNRTWSNYTTCIDKEDLSFRQRINNIYLAGYSTSVIALLISLGIFFHFRSMQCTRITIHKNLFISFIVNNIMWIIWYTEVVSKPSVTMKNELPCQILHVLVQYFLVSNYFWMFCEGLYLHTVLIVAFVTEGKLLKWFYLIGWGAPVFIIAIYASVRGTSSEAVQYCWIDEKFSWIISGPVCLSMLLNFIFLINIVRVLVTKLRAVNSPDAHQTRKAVRATLILIPLLGLHYLVTPFRPSPRSFGEAIYETVSAIVTSFQGLMVALLFCFFNGEVLALLRRKWDRAFSIQRRANSYAATTVTATHRNKSKVTKNLLSSFV